MKMDVRPGFSPAPLDPPAVSVWLSLLAGMVVAFSAVAIVAFIVLGAR